MVAAAGGGGVFNDPLLYYTMDDADVSGTTFTDRGSGANNGTSAGSPGSVAGHLAEARSFDGSTQYITAGSPANLAIASNMSATAWIKPSTVPGSRRHILAYGYRGFNLLWYFLGINADATLVFGSTTHEVLSVATFTADVWMHVCGTYDGTTYKIYINGALDNSSAGSPLSDSGGRPMVVGGSTNIGGVDGFDFPGSLDEVRIYGRVLSADDVTALYAF